MTIQKKRYIGNTRLSTSVRNAAMLLLERGFQLAQVKAAIDSLKQPSFGLVYIDEIPLQPIS